MESDTATQTVTCGEATMRLLTRYGVDTVFGIPGVHTLDFYRGLANSHIRHIQARNEAGAGFMADGFARASGRPGVALVISGPGVTNALTPLGQAWADSVPVLLVSSETATFTHGRGWGMLHEIPDQRAVTAPLTALSARARHPDEVPDLVAQAFALFASGRPRPVHISIPVDVAAMPVADAWMPDQVPQRPQPDPGPITEAAELLRHAARPLILVGGGAVDAGESLTRLADRLNAPVIATTAGKGIVPDDHPLSLSGGIVRPEVQTYLTGADVVLAVGTEIAETDSFVDHLDLPARLVRIDIDPAKIVDRYPAAVGIVADARPALEALVTELGEHSNPVDRARLEQELTELRASVWRNLSQSERRHVVALDVLRMATPEDTIFMGDICQLVFTGAFSFPVRRPRLWHYPAGFCTLGGALPNAIGAKLAFPDRPVVCLVGDGGVMFTIQELIVASELELGIPIVIWDNGGLKQIRDDMLARGNDPVGVAGRNPDFAALAMAMGAVAVRPDGRASFAAAIRDGLAADRPTVIVIDERDPWLLGADLPVGPFDPRPWDRSEQG